MIEEYFNGFNHRISGLEYKSKTQLRDIARLNNKIEEYNNDLIKFISKTKLVLTSTKKVNNSTEDYETKRNLITNREMIISSPKSKLINYEGLKKRVSLSTNFNIAIINQPENDRKKAINASPSFNIYSFKNFKPSGPSLQVSQSYLSDAIKKEGGGLKTTRNSNSNSNILPCKTNVPRNTLIKNYSEKEYPKYTPSNNPEDELDLKINFTSESNKSLQTKNRSTSVLPKEKKGPKEMKNVKRSHTVFKSNPKNNVDPEEKCLESIKMLLPALSNSKDKLALILAINRVVPIKLRATLTIGVKIVNKVYHLKYILNDLINFLNEKKKKLEENQEVYYSNEELATHIKSQYSPSKTVYVFLNMLAATDEQVFRTEFSLDGQLVAKILILLLLNPRFTTIKSHSEFDYIGCLYKKVLPKYGRTRVKELIFYDLIGKIHFHMQSYNQLQNLISNNNEVFDLHQETFSNHSKMTKILVYFILEISKFAEKKCSDGTYVFILRLLKREEELTKKKIKRLKFFRSLHFS